MPTIQLTEAERLTAVHALRLAADRFEEDAKVTGRSGYAALEEQFIRQFVDSRVLAQKLEDAE